MATYSYQQITIQNPAKFLPVDARSRKKGTSGGYILPPLLIQTAPPIDTKIEMIYSNTGKYLGYLEYVPSGTKWPYNAAYTWGGKDFYKIKSSRPYSSDIKFGNVEKFIDILETSTGNTALRLVEITLSQEDMVDMTDESAKITTTLEGLNAILNSQNLTPYSIMHQVAAVDKFDILNKIKGPAVEVYNARNEELVELQQKYIREYVTNLIAAVQDKLDVQNTGKELSTDYGFDIT
jgi:hypothetical protein